MQWLLVDVYLSFGSVLLLFGATVWKQMNIREAGKHISWSIFGFIAGMFVLVRAVARKEFQLPK